MKFLTKLWYTFRFGLILNELRYLFITIGIEISPFYWAQEDISEIDLPKIKSSFKGYTFDFFGPDEMKQIAMLTKNHPLDTLLSRLKKGNICYGMKYNDQIAAFCWIDLNECNYKGNRQPLNKDDVYVFDSHTIKNFRGFNLASCLRYRLYAVLKKMGKKRIFSVIQITNAPAIKFKNKLKTQFLWLGVYICFFNKIRHTFIIKQYNH